jgi:serine/threonine protein kinase
MWDPLKKIGSWLRREEEEPPPGKLDRLADEDDKENGRPHSSGEHHGHPSNFLHRRGSRKVVPGLPRPLTFKRQNSEKRERLLAVPVDGEQRRAASADRRSSRLALTRTLSPPPVNMPSSSAPDVLSPHNSGSHQQEKAQPTIGGAPDSNIPAGARQVDYSMGESVDYLSSGEQPPRSAAGDSFYERASQRSGSDIDELQLQEELEAKWILNLSMHFRDMSDREKFFITYAEQPNKWRRVTVSCDYRELTPDSLEFDLKSLHYQRDKSARIYEAIRDSLPDIQFYDTVTNLKLQTADGRLHVHVTEDVNEIIPYPALTALDHLPCKKFKERDVSFDSHISGFVYKVSVTNKVYIKKEIPGPDAVEEFLYEINALCNLQDSKSVIKFEGIIVDEREELIKGLLISYAEQGALVDLIYDFKNSDHMLWERRERWARQIVEGLSEIHEAGFVQGDFTLSNIVIDHYDNAKIIDINRRGCPVGWEPPELARLIESGQRISIYIGVKSDLFQLGMVLWALAEQQDEPERQERHLLQKFDKHSDVPAYFQEVVRACLSSTPRGRPSAKDILTKFPSISDEQSKPMAGSRQSVSTHRSDKEYIDPATAVDLDDISNVRHLRSRSSFSNVHMPSTEYIGSSSSYILPSSNRGRSPGHRNNSHNRRSDYSPYPTARSIMSLDDSELENELASLPASRDTRWEQVYVDGDTKLVQRGGHDIDTRDFAVQEPKDVCITTPPGELANSFIESKKSDDTPLSLSTVAELQPPPPHQATTSTELGRELGHSRHPSNKASFSDRVHHPTPATDPEMTDKLNRIENEIDLASSVTSSAPPTRTNTGFSSIFHAPMHQDSGFNEPERESFESERIRQSLDMAKADLEDSTRERIVEERMWDEKDNTYIGEGVRGDQLVLKPVAERRISEEAANEKPLEEKVSNATIRPPSLTIPEFHHHIPEAVDVSPPARSAEGSNQKEKQHGRRSSDHNPPLMEARSIKETPSY